MADANNNKKQNPAVNAVNKRLDSLNSMIDNLYNSTYSTRVDNRNDMERITNGLEDNLDDLLSSVNGQNVSDISTLILRLQRKNKGGNFTELQQSIE